MKFVVVGDIGRNGLYHVGDEAMTEAAIQALRHRGATDLTLVATHPEEATRLHGLPAVPRIGFGPDWTASERDDALAPLLGGTISPGTPAATLSAEISSSDAVIIAGGGNMNAEFAHHLDERVAIARLARRHGRPIFVAGQTIGPNVGERERRLLSEVLEASTAFAVRDDGSYHLALDLGIDATRLSRISDDAILLNVAGDDAREMRELPTRRYLVGSFTSDPGQSGLSQDAYLAQITRTLDLLSEELDADVLLVPHVGSLTGLARVGDELSDWSIAERSVTRRITALTPRVTSDVLALTAGALATISTRYHPVVFGPVLGVPTIGIPLSFYSLARMRGALEPFGLEDFVTPFNAWDAIPAATREAVDRIEELRGWSQDRFQARKALQDQWWDEVAELRVPGPTSPQGAPRFPIESAWAHHVQRARTLLPVPETRGSSLPEELAASRERIASLTRDRDDLTKQVETYRRELKKAQSRKVVRLADRAGELLRRVKSDPVAKSPPPPPPLLSVIVPIYNVEDYLHRCLRSICDQTLTDLEIILIDDGSTDSSGDIAQEFAERDRRITLRPQENAGLGAARNRGQELAQGEYIIFIDSDDVVPRGAFRSLLTALQNSGSDIAIGGTSRIRPDGTVFALPWSMELRRHTHLTTLARSPRLLRDFYTWNKVFRHDFWRTHNFRFREGVLFEDQPVITEAMLLARTIDVVAEVTYHWRVRGDRSSLTGTMYETPDIITRHEATRLTFDALQRHHASEDQHHWWRWTLVEHHLPHYLKATAGLDTHSEYDAVVRIAQEFLTVAQVVGLDEASAATRTLVYLAMTGTQDQVRRFLDNGGGNIAKVPLVFVDGQLQADLPLRDEVPPPDARIFRISSHEQRLVAILTSQTWLSRSTLQLGVKVGLSQTPADEGLDIQAALTWRDGRIEIPATCTPDLTEDESRRFGVEAWGEANIVVDVGALAAEHRDALVGGMDLEIVATTPHLQRTGPLSHSEPVLQGANLAGADVARLTWNCPRGLSLRLATVSYTIAAIRHSGADVDVTVQAPPHLDPTYVLLRHAGTPDLRYLLRRVGEFQYSATIDSSEIPHRRPSMVLVEDRSGDRGDVHASPSPNGHRDAHVRVFTTPWARLRLTREAD